MAGGMPLAFTQEDFLVLYEFFTRIGYSTTYRLSVLHEKNNCFKSMEITWFSVDRITSSLWRRFHNSDGHFVKYGIVQYIWTISEHTARLRCTIFVNELQIQYCASKYLNIRCQIISFIRGVFSLVKCFWRSHSQCSRMWRVFVFYRWNEIFGTKTCCHL